MRRSTASAHPRVDGRRTWRAVLALGVAALVAPTAVEAWPAIQDAAGQVFLCDTRPAQLSDGRWACRSAGVNLAGALVDVVRPGTPPGARPWWDAPPGARGRWGPSPWRPPSEPSGYDALDPWLGGTSPER
jgi:hypothetical protein